MGLAGSLPASGAIHAMQPDAFSQACVVVCAGFVDDEGTRSSYDDMAAVRVALLSSLLDSGLNREAASSATNRFIAGCMSKSFHGDVLLGELPNRRPVLLVKPEVARGRSRQQIVQQVHQGLVERAVNRHEPVPQSILDFYGIQPGVTRQH